MRLKDLLVLFLFFFFVGCTTRTGDFTMPSAPTTKLFLNSITLPDSLGKAGTIRLYWSGESQNGYLKGFEISIDSNECSLDAGYREQLNWGFTTRTDSAFLFSIKRGQIYGQVSFYARAIDNNETKDPNPPCLRIPVKNSFPVIKLDRFFNSKPTTDTVHSVFSLSWNISDEDGEANLDSVYVKVNHSKWVAFSKSITQVTFIPTNPNSKDSTTANILGGLDGNNLNLTSGHLRVNATDTVFVRVKDISDSYSKLDTTIFYYKAKTSDVLYVDAYSGSLERIVFDPILENALGVNYDIYDMYRSNAAYFPLNWNLTFTKYLGLYKKVFWVTDNANPGGLSIESGATAIQSLVNNGGKIFISATKLPSDIGSPVFQYLPIDSMSKNIGQARLQSNIKIVPQNGFADTLLTTQLFTNVSTIYAKPENQLFNAATIQKLSGWQGPETLACFGKDNNGKLNRVVFGIDLHRLNGRPTDLSNFIKNILVTEFNK